MKRLAKAVEEYLALRRGLGFKLRPETWWLPDFVSYLERHGSSRVTTALALRWAQQPRGTSPTWWARRLAAVRLFAKHYQCFDPRTEVPASDLLPTRPQRAIPHIYSEHEIAALMDAAAAERNRLTAATYTTLIGLLAATGMRLSEALNLESRDLDLVRCRLTIRNAKFGKTRYVPIQSDTSRALMAYARKRDRLAPLRQGHVVFGSRAGKRLVDQNVSFTFDRIRRRAELGRPEGHAPRIHELRHTFAVQTLRDWYRAGVDVERRLPVLSTYLGHVSPSSTYWYLTATPDLLALACRRAERAWRRQP
jgi:site-specific recombinase XerD